METALNMKTVMRLPGVALGMLGLAMLKPATADAADVVASIAPVHSIAAAIMQGTGEPRLLLDQSASPHMAQLSAEPGGMDRGCGSYSLDRPRTRDLSRAAACCVGRIELHPHAR